MTWRRLSPIALLGVLQLTSGCVVATTSSGNGSDASFLLLLLPLIFIVLMAFSFRRLLGRGGRTPRTRQSTSANAVTPQVLRAELSVLADDVVRLEPQVTLKEQARADFDAATHRYRVAQAAMDYAKEPADLVRVQRVVDEANWSMSRARAILEGRPLPSPPQQLRRPGQLGEPAVTVDERDRPVYVDSPASFRSGWFAGGGFFGPLLLGGFGSVWTDADESDDLDDGWNEPNEG